MTGSIPTPTQPEKAGPDAPQPDRSDRITDTEIAELVVVVALTIFWAIVWPPATLLVLAAAAALYSRAQENR